MNKHSHKCLFPVSMASFGLLCIHRVRQKMYAHFNILQLDLLTNHEINKSCKYGTFRENIVQHIVIVIRPPASKKSIDGIC